MINRDAGENLLLGVLALQMGFIGRSDLVAATTAWASDKRKPLAEILVALGALGEGRRALLESLVREHLKAHGEDPERSLATISPIGSVRDDLELIPDSELHRTLSRIATAAQSADLGATRPPGTAAPSIGLRYNILRPHAKGGQGEVFVALDREVNREVALKEIQDSHADEPASRSRFLREAEITGGLEHPGLVPVYGIGQYSDGRPYYAMRFIRGESLRDAIRRFHLPDGPLEERSLEFRQLLGRFVDVCNAVAYAHSRGVIHRDLKPSNVMLGKFGETLVVDWGLAKIVDQPGGDDGPGERMIRPSSGGSTATQLGQALGTPQYMSPEQAAGLVERLGPSSDVYGLGATLYCLLTGRAPFADLDVGSILARVQRGDFPPPRLEDRSIPRALEAICLKAMALEVRDRYATAQALADDIEHWLADEPVSAYRDPLSIRLMRSGRRHRTLVVGVAAALVVATIGLSVGTVLISRQRDRAERNLTLARQVVDEMYTGVADRLVDQRRMETYQREILEKALRFYERFALPQSGDPMVRAEAARAGVRVGDILEKLGRTKEAEEAYGRAIVTLGGPVTGSRGSETERQLAAGCQERLARVYAGTGRTAEAESALRKASQIRQVLAEDGPADVDAQAGLAHVHQKLGGIFGDTGRTEEAESEYRQALIVHRRLAASHPADVRHNSDIADVENSLGGLYRRSSRASEAEAAFKSAVTRYEELVKRSPNATSFRDRLAIGLGNLALMASELGKTEEAVATYGRAIAVRGPLADDHPDVPEYRSSLAGLLHDLGGLHRDANRWPQAEEAFNRSLTAFQKLVSEHPDVPEYHADLARVHNSLATVYAATYQSAKAEQSFRAVATIAEALSTAHPQIVDHWEHLGTAFGNLGSFYYLDGRPVEAETAYRQSIRVREAQIAEHPRDTHFRERLADVYINLAELLRAGGRQAEAERLLRRGRDEYAALASDQPQVRAHRQGLARGTVVLGECLREAGRLSEAEAPLRESVALYEKLVAEQPDDAESRSNRADAHNSLGALLRDLGRMEEAGAELRLGRDLWGELYRADPEAIEPAFGYGRACRESARYFEARGEPGAALDSLDQAVGTLRSAHQREPRIALVKQGLREALGERAQARSSASRHAEALADWDEALLLAPADLRDMLRMRRALTLAYLGDQALATSEAESVVQAHPREGEYLLAAVRVHAVSSMVPALGASQSGNPASDRDRLASRAVEWLGRCEEIGFFQGKGIDWAARLSEDSGLAPLRAREDYRALVMDIAFPNDPFERPE